MRLSRQSIALVWTTKNKETKHHIHRKHKRETNNFPLIKHLHHDLVRQEMKQALFLQSHSQHKALWGILHRQLQDLCITDCVIKTHFLKIHLLCFKYTVFGSLLIHIYTQLLYHCMQGKWCHTPQQCKQGVVYRASVMLLNWANIRQGFIFGHMVHQGY